MQRLFHLTAAVSALVAVIAGCSGASTSPSKTPEASVANDSGQSHDGHSHSQEATLPDDVLAALPEEDRAPVKLQKICPVSGEPLGSMGTPIKVVTDSGSAYMCCAGCEDEFRRDPKPYLAKLPAPAAP